MPLAAAAAKNEVHNNNNSSITETKRMNGYFYSGRDIADKLKEQVENLRKVNRYSYNILISVDRPYIYCTYRIVYTISYSSKD